MMLLHPILFGVGIACVAIPILIHFLMRRRRRPIRWAAMRFVIEAYKQQQRRLRLEQILLLLARGLLVALIALAVGRPMFGADDGAESGPRDLALLVDNSIGGATTDASGVSDLARSIEVGAELLGLLDPARGDRASLISLASPVTRLVEPTADIALVERRLRALIATDSRADVAGGFAMVEPGTQVGVASGSSGEGPRAEIALLSGFRAGSMLGLGGVVTGSRVVVCPPSETALANVGLVGLDPVRPVVVGGRGRGAAQIRVRLSRSGVGVESAQVSTVGVSVVGAAGRRAVGEVSVRWAPGQSAADALVDVDLTGEEIAGRVVLRAALPPDANERDNVARAVFDLRDRLRVGVLGTRRFGGRPSIPDFAPSDWVALALAPTGGAASIEAEVLDASRVGTSELASFDALVIAQPGRVSAEGWDGVDAFSRRGRPVLLIASPTSGAQAWTDAASEALGRPWEIALEPTELVGASLSAGAAVTPDPLALVRAELAELTRDIGVSRLLGVMPGDATQVLLETDRGDPVLVHVPPTVAMDGADTARGSVLFLGVGLDLAWTDLPARPLMVPLLQELVRSTVGGLSSRRSSVAGATVAAPTGAIELVPIVGQSPPDASSVSVSGGRTREPVRRAGAFQAISAEGAALGESVVQPDANGALVDPMDRDRVIGMLREDGGGSFAWTDAGLVDGAPGAERRSDTPGPGLLVLLFALGVALVELVLARVASHADTSGSLVLAGGDRA